MAKIVLTDCVVMLNTTSNISTYVSSVTLTTDVGEAVTTGMTEAGVTRIGGLRDNSVQLEIMQDFAASTIEPVVYPLIGTVVPMSIKPTNTARSATNPEYQFNVLISSWSPIAGAVGDLATVSVTWQISGAITKNVTP